MHPPWRPLLPPGNDYGVVTVANGASVIAASGGVRADNPRLTCRRQNVGCSSL